jgi:hypothetical protein
MFVTNQRTINHKWVNAGEFSASVNADRLPGWGGRDGANCGRVQQFVTVLGGHLEHVKSLRRPA